PDQLLGPGLIQVAGAERLRVTRAELEDVPDLDRRLDSDWRPVDGVARRHRAHVDAFVLEVPPRLDAPDMRVGAVGPGDIAAGRDRSVEQHRYVRADGADEPRGAQPPLHLIGTGRPEVGPQRVAKLDLVDAVIAAHDHELHRVVVD